MKKNNIIWLDNARIYAIFAVIIIHVSSGVIKGISTYDSYEWWIGNFFDSFTRWGVPVFVMISGYLLLLQRENKDIIFFYKKRFSKLFIPLVFWSIFYLIYDSWTVPLSSYDIVKRLLFGVPYYHMWFIYMIIGLYLFTPFLSKLLKILNYKELKILIIILFLMSMLNNIVDYFMWKNMKIFFNLFLDFIPYFLLGGMIRKYHYRWNITTSVVVFVFSGLLTMLGCYFLSKYTTLYNGLYFYNYLSLTVVPMSISIIMIFQRNTKEVFTKYLTRKIAFLSFGVYLIHPIILNGFMYFNIVAKEYNPLLSIPLISISVFLIAFILVFFIQKIALLKRII